MRIPALIVASITALLTVGALAQQPVPDAPQPQKKQTAKPPDPTPPTPPPAKDDNAFPEDVSKKAAEAASQTKQPDTGDANSFPEEQSEAAAKAAAKQQPHSPLGEEPAVNDPARARRDDEVGKFYLQSGDYHAALLRYQDATASDPTNVNAIFGLAEAQRLLKKNADAARNYQLYLDIVPNGPRAKQALKALREIQAGK
jgi:tetratricopeptide (TPR) repeat protein